MEGWLEKEQVWGENQDFCSHHSQRDEVGSRVWSSQERSQRAPSGHWWYVKWSQGTGLANQGQQWHEAPFFPAKKKKKITEPEALQIKWFRGWIRRRNLLERLRRRTSDGKHQDRRSHYSKGRNDLEERAVVTAHQMLWTGPTQVGFEDKSLRVVFLGARGCLQNGGGQKSTAELGDEQMGSPPGKERGVEGSAHPSKHLTLKSQ